MVQNNLEGPLISVTTLFSTYVLTELKGLPINGEDLQSYAEPNLKEKKKHRHYYP